MATDLERLVVQLSADIKQYERGMQQAMGVTNRQARAIENRWRQANSSLDNIGRDMARSIVTPLAGVGAAIGTRQIMSYADAWTRAGNLIAAAGQVAGMSGRSLEGINQIANNTRSGFEETADLYAKLLRSSSGVAESEQQVAQATETVNKAFKAGGAAASEMSAGILQLSQGLGSGVLQGDELRSVRENAPLLAQAIADYFGTTVAGLKKLGEEGQLTSDKVFKAILSAKDKINSAFNATAQTIGDAVTKVNNAFIQYIGKSDESLSASGRLIAGLNALADNFDHVADTTVKVAAIIASALVGRSIAGMIVKLGVASEAVLTFIAALRTASIATALGGVSAAAGPLGLLIGGTVATALALYYSNSKDATVGSKEYAKALREVEEAGKKTAPAIEDVAKKTAAAAEEAYAGAAARARQAMASLADDAIRIIDQGLASRGRESPATDELVKNVRAVYEGYKNGKNSVDDLKRALDALSTSSALPFFVQMAAALNQILPKLEQAEKTLSTIGKNKLNKDLEPFNELARNEQRQAKLEGDARQFLADAEKRNSLTKDQLALEEKIAEVKKRPGAAGLLDAQIKVAAQNEINAEKRRSDEGKKAPRTAETRFDQDIQAVRDRTAALIQEQQIVTENTRVQETRRMELQLEQQALKNLREEARRNGDENWREVQLSPDRIAAIKQVSTAYGEQAAALERMSGPLNTYVRESADANKQLQDIAVRGLQSLEDGLMDAINGTKTFEEAFRSMAASVLNDLARMVIRMTVLGPLAKGIGGLFGLADGGPVGGGAMFATGGYVSGPGSSRSDSIPARLSNGEYVVNAKATAQNRPLLDAINSGRLPKFAEGGYVGAAPRLPNLRSGGSSAVSISYSPVYNVAQGADPKAIDELRRAQAEDRAAFKVRAVQAIKEAQSRRGM